MPVSEDRAGEGSKLSLLCMVRPVFLKGSPAVLQLDAEFCDLDPDDCCGREPQPLSFDHECMSARPEPGVAQILPENIGDKLLH